MGFFSHAAMNKIMGAPTLNQDDQFFVLDVTLKF